MWGLEIKEKKVASACKLRPHQIKHVHAEWNFQYETYGLYAFHQHLCDVSWPISYRSFLQEWRKVWAPELYSHWKLMCHLFLASENIHSAVTDSHHRHIPPVYHPQSSVTKHADCSPHPCLQHPTLLVSEHRWNSWPLAVFASWYLGSSYGSWSWRHRGTYWHKGRCTCLQWWSLLCTPPNPPTDRPVAVCARRKRRKSKSAAVSYRRVFSHDSSSSGFQPRPLTNC